MIDDIKRGSTKAVCLYLLGRQQTWHGCAEFAGLVDILNVLFWLMTGSHTGDNEAIQ